jgi:hypothetical protein
MTRGRPFEPGNKFGRGRPQGSRKKRSARGQELVDDCREILIRKALVLAINGDVQVMRILLPYALGRPAERPIQTGRLSIGSVMELLKSSEQVFQRLSSGKLSLSEARSLSSLIEERRLVLETVELEKRVRAVEEPPESKKLE